MERSPVVVDVRAMIYAGGNGVRSICRNPVQGKEMAWSPLHGCRNIKIKEKKEIKGEQN